MDYKLVMNDDLDDINYLIIYELTHNF